MAQSPSFPFYASDWLGSNHRAMMTLQEQGAYVNLLARQWSDPTCSLPDDDEALACLSELGEAWLKGSSTTLRKCFPKHPVLDARIANPKLLTLREEKDEWVAKCSEAGKKSGEVRRANAAATKTSGKREPSKGSTKGSSTNLGTKRELNTNSPLPSPSSISKPPIVPLELLPWLQWWNRMHAGGLVPAGVDENKPSQAVVGNWKQSQADAEVCELLADRDRIEQRIRGSQFCREGWFRLEKLFGRRNKDKELILRILLDGGYQDGPKPKPQASGSFADRRPQKSGNTDF